MVSLANPNQTVNEQKPRTMLDSIAAHKRQMLNEYWATQGCVREDVDEEALYRAICVRKESIEQFYVDADNRFEEWCRERCMVPQPGAFYSDPLTNWTVRYKGKEAHAQEKAEELVRLQQQAVPESYFARTFEELSTEDEVYLVEDVLVENQPMVIKGKSKSFKTGIMLDLAFNLAQGAGFMFLGKFAVNKQCNVAVFSGESGERTLGKRWRAIKATYAKLGHTVRSPWINLEAPALGDPQVIARIVQDIRKLKLDVIVFDPLYLSLLRGQRARGVESSNVFAMGALLYEIANACVKEGCTPIFVHHDKKTANDDSDISDMNDGAGAGIQEFMRQWISIKKRPGKPHDKEHGVYYMNIDIGGSAGHAVEQSLTIEQGTKTTGWKWKVTCERLISSKDDRKREKEAQEREQEAQERERLYQCIATAPGITLKRAATAAHLGPDKAERHMAYLRAEGRIGDRPGRQKDSVLYEVIEQAGKKA